MRNFWLINLTFLLSSSSLLYAANSKSKEFKCAEQITVRKTALDVPKGWQAWDAASTGENNIKKLTALGIYEGHPGKKIHLAPTNADSADNFWSWTFIPFGEKRKEPIWFVCQYEGTEMILGRSLPTKISKCRVNFKDSSDSRRVGPLNCE